MPLCVSVCTCIRNVNSKCNLRLPLKHAFFFNAITPKSCHQMPWLGIRNDRWLTHYAGSLTSTLFLCDFATRGREPVTFGVALRIGQALQAEPVAGKEKITIFSHSVARQSVIFFCGTLNYVAQMFWVVIMIWLITNVSVTIVLIEPLQCLLTC